MLLYVLFIKTSKNSQPTAITVLDEATVETSEFTVKEYQDLTLAQVKEALGSDELKSWGWFEVRLPNITRSRIVEELEDITPTFASYEVKSVPKEQTHPSIAGITVTVGRIPGKLVDDEII